MHEQEVIELLTSQNEKGIDVLLIHYGPLMKYIIAPILQNPQDREDCLSEVTMKVWEKIAQFDATRGSWTSWLTAVTRNTALNYLQKNTRHAHAHSESISESLVSPEPSPEEQILQKEFQESLNRAVQQLSPTEQLLFYRKYYYLQSTTQIAAELGTTERSVEGKLYRIKKKLRKLLGGEPHA